MNRSRETKAALLTPAGRGAVATVLLWGPEALKLVEQFFRSAGGRSAAAAAGDILVGRWRDAEGEEIVVAPWSDERIEIHCHGGNAASRAILDDLVRSGCREIAGETWLGDDSLDEISRAALSALVHARTERTAAILLDQYHGALASELRSIRRLASLDRREEARRRVDALLAYQDVGRHLSTPYRVVLAGEPNVGKSSLINALLGYRRSIVHPTPGATRDLVTGETAFDGWPAELVDTAGLRSADDSLEAAGVAHSEREMAAADLVLLIFDAGAPWRDEDERLLAQWPEALIVHNKQDLAPAGERHAPAGMPTSALSGAGVEELATAIARRLVPAPPAPGGAVPFRSSDRQGLRRLAEALAAGESRPALVDICRGLLDEETGERHGSR